MIEKTRDVFDDWARRGRDEGMHKGHFPRAEQALEMLGLEQGDMVADLGCGNGWAARWMRERIGADGSAVGLDAAPEMISKASAIEAGTEGLSFLVGVFEDLPFEDGEVDHAFSMEALYYAQDLDKALADIHRVLRPGGSFCFCTDFFTENPHCHGWQEMMGIPMALHSEQDWCARFAAADLELVSTKRCLDPRPVEDDCPEEERESRRDFRENIGALAILVQRV